jgi:hypothetical protein
MNEPHLVGINEAARLTGKNKATISRDTKSGKLSATVSDSGSKRYQVAELERVYGTLRNPDTGYAPPDNHRNQPDELTSATSVIPEVVKAKDEVIAVLREQVEDLKRDRDNWRDQALRALPAPAETSAAPVRAPAQKRGIWPFRRTVTT